ncbi:MAG: carboxypeptidase regulatory-like domain-containing protein [Vicinamibacterales bacterium]
MIVAAALLMATSAVPVAAQAQPRTAELRVTVRDPSGAVIPDAAVTVTGSDKTTAPIAKQSVSTDAEGIADVDHLPPGHYSITIAFSGFETRTLTNVRLKPGDNHHDVTLGIAKVAETVAVGRDAQTAASDPNNERLGNVLTKAQIEALPDDPDEMEQQLKQMAGPGAEIRVDGFHGGKLPPKSQIRSIRFASNMFAAENHNGGMTFVDIETQPGLGPLRGSTDVSYRGRALDARNAFQPTKGPEETKQYNGDLSGTLWQNRTSFSLGITGANLFDSANVFAAQPGGDDIAAVRRPSSRSTVNLRLDQALTTTQTLQASVQRNAVDQHELGVGNFDLPDHAYSQNATDTLFRLRDTGPWSKSVNAETRLQIRQSSSASASALETPTIDVLDAFTSGGAQQSGGTRSTELEYATNVDYARGRHSMRFGTLVQGGSYRTDANTNYLGTFTFSSLADYEAGRPATFTERAGNPTVQYSNWDAGFFAQDDWRAAKSLTLSGGIREEFQTHIGNHWDLAPRAGLTWSPFKNGKTIVRAGGGVFNDWLDASVYQQTLQVNGVNQQDLVIVNPSYPDPSSDDANAEALPPSVYSLAPGLALQKRALVLAGVSQQISMFNVNVNYTHADGWDRYRGRNVNAPLDGVRPDPTLGNVTQVESTGGLRNDSLNVGVNLFLPNKHTMLFANYGWLHQRNDADGPFSLPADSYNLAAEWGPAAGVPSQIASAVFNTMLWDRLRVAVSTTAHSGTPYDITTGRDNNGDTVFTDRPAGVGRNSGTGAGMWDVAARLTYVFGFGQKPQQAGPGGQVVMITRRAGGGAGDLLGPAGGLGGGAEDKRVRIELFASASNLFNRVGLMGYSGVMTSPFFGMPTAAGPARKLDVGLRIGF